MGYTIFLKDSSYYRFEGRSFGHFFHHPKKNRLLLLFFKSTCCLPAGVQKPNVDKRNSQIKLVLYMGTRCGAFLTLRK